MCRKVPLLCHKYKFTAKETYLHLGYHPSSIPSVEKFFSSTDGYKAKFTFFFHHECIIKQQMIAKNNIYFSLFTIPSLKNKFSNALNCSQIENDSIKQ